MVNTKLKKQLALIAMLTVGAYLICAFFNGSFNPVEMSKTSKAWVCLAWAASSAFSIFLND